MEKLSFFERFNLWLKQSITIRLITIGILILFLLIPVSMVESVIREREERKNEATQEISSTWGAQQTVCGPVLTIPYKTVTKVYDNEQTEKLG